MSGQSTSSQARKAPDPSPILEVAAGFMRSKHLFVAAEVGVFKALANGEKTLPEIARELKLPPRTARILVDAATALGFLERTGNHYRNAEVAQAFLSGNGVQDMTPFLRFWNQVSYPRWEQLEESVRRGRGTAGEFNFTAQEQQIFSEGVEAATAGQAYALAETYDFGRHRRVLDLGGGTGSFLIAIAQRHLQVKSTLFEFPSVATVARERLAKAGLAGRITVVEGNLLTDALPEHHDAVILANVVHGFTAEQNQELLRRVRSACEPDARVLLVDFWTNEAHTEPLFAALMAGEFLINAGDGDVYSAEEGKEWLARTGWRVVEHAALAAPAGVLVGEAAQ